MSEDENIDQVPKGNDTRENVNENASQDQTLNNRLGDIEKIEDMHDFLEQA